MLKLDPCHHLGSYVCACVGVVYKYVIIESYSVWNCWILYYVCVFYVYNY